MKKATAAKAVKPITERVKSFEDACKVLNISDASILSDNDSKDEAAYKKLKVIATALNEGWVPNWSNYDENKYYPWFFMNDDNAPLGFSFGGYGHVRTLTYLGARLVFKSRELARYAGEQFVDIYRDFMVIA